MSTIERLSSQDGWQEWKLIALEGILPRLYTMFCPINDKELLIYGGYHGDGEEDNPSFFIVNPISQTVVEKQDDQYQQTLCENSARMLSEGRAIAYVARNQHDNF